MKGRRSCFWGGAGGIASGHPGTAATTLQSNQDTAQWGYSVAGAGDVNGDGYADVIVGAQLYTMGMELAEGAAFMFLGGGGRHGRPLLTRQLRGGVSDLPVQPWGLSYAPDRFKVRLRAVDPAGRGRVKLETEYCPPGTPFGAMACGRHVSPCVADVGPTGATTLTSEVVAATNTLYRWRSRVLYAPYSVTDPGITEPPKRRTAPSGGDRLAGRAQGDIGNRQRPRRQNRRPPLPWRSASPAQRSERSRSPSCCRRAGHAKLELFDVTGRRVVAREVSPQHAGRYTASLNNAHELPPGVYMVRVSQSGRRATARVVLLQ